MEIATVNSNHLCVDGYNECYLRSCDAAEKDEYRQLRYEVSMKISSEYDPATADLEVIADAIRKYGLAEIGCDAPIDIASFLRKDDQVVGGVCGRMIKKRLLLDLLWVKEEYRNNGYGTKLLAAIENRAKSDGCQAVILETFNARAVAFYFKFRYRCIAKIQDYIPGFDKHILLKLFDESLIDN